MRIACLLLSDGIALTCSLLFPLCFVDSLLIFLFVFLCIKGFPADIRKYVVLMLVTQRFRWEGLGMPARGSPRNLWVAIIRIHTFLFFLAALLIDNLINIVVLVSSEFVPARKAIFDEPLIQHRPLLYLAEDDRPISSYRASLAWGLQ